MAEGGVDQCKVDEPEKSTLETVLTELKEIKSGQTNLKNSFESKIDELGKKLAADIAKQCEELKADFKKDMDLLNAKVNSLEYRIAQLEVDGTDANLKSGDPLENTNLTVVVTNVFQHPEEDPVETAKALLTAMGRDNTNTRIASKVTVSAAKRLPNRSHRGPSLLKISFLSLEEKKYILRNKSLLKNTTGYERVFLRSSQTHMERLLHINFRTMLDKLPWGKDYRLTASGRIVEKNVDTRHPHLSHNEGTYTSGNPGPSGQTSLTRF